ncbi:MAG TPA: fluoride efflux transporter CrcB [Streptosporangiaceae bacterium]
MRASDQTYAPEASAVFPRRRLRHRLRREWGVLAAVAVGGGCGALARYLIDQAIPVRPGAMPWATLVINVVGCLVLGALNVYLLEVWPPRRYVRPLCAIGFLGGFTTFSTYTAEIRDLMGRGAVPLAAGYALGSLAAGVAALWGGVAAARLASRHRLRRVGGGGRVNGR